MVEGLSRIIASPIYRIVVAQVIATLFASALCLTIGPVAAVSALLAGAACIVPGLYVLMVSLRPVPAGATGLGNALRGEVGRLVLTAALLVAGFVVARPLDAMAFFATLVLLQLCNVLVPLREARKLLKRR